MEPLIALIATTLTVHFVARSRAPNWRPWPVALRTGVAFMFIMTGISHFIGKREELIAMVPPALPAPELLVAVTGILELAGAGALLLWPVMRRWAAGGLALILIAMYPANVHKALSGEDLPWNELLIPRTIVQLVFLAAVLIVLVYENRANFVVVEKYDDDGA
ncbi:MAG: DoxX family protein [Ancrocorticia populi]|uniref:DoxX family protein n=1 Tax=Ancrocorticia populi TaxID=2175228 RepID=UPI003F8FA322